VFLLLTDKLTNHSF